MSLVSAMPYYFCLIVLSAAFAYGRHIKFENCGGVVNAVEVKPCPEEPCKIPRGESAFITVHCLSNVDANELKLYVTAEVAGIEVPYPGMRRNACQGKNITCPIKVNQQLSYIQKFEVRSFFPQIQTMAKFELQTNDETVCCFRTPVHVV